MGIKKSQDNIFASPLSEIVDFVFDEKVVDVFPDMINRSVPGYSTIINLIGTLAQRYARPDTRLYDLGCSLGAASLSMRHRLIEDGCEIISVDNAEAMIDRLDKILQRDNSKTPVQTLCADVQDVEIQNASVIVMNFTLQFISLSDREKIITKIYDGLNKGGCLILSEKLAFSDSRENDIQIDLHHAFKRSNGYSDLEIAQKRNALENVLLPETKETHIQRLKETGFTQVIPWFQCFNFASFIAIK
ncbi:MAG: carboxy-S-adenosyl-L-methionine synthase CmoA [Gammaproteobacteria bacterium]|nr:carboxy-S-adenosyl-L-methionine synthase CmoA [Gammaproteobacteria bacterium]MCW9031163.1 carboxy-S-adenosyl-L-methionine synthase CmoA [Gammaproteobacteria bacterium]